MLISFIPCRRELASSGRDLARLLTSTRKRGEAAPVGRGQLQRVPVFDGCTDGGEQTVVLAVVLVRSGAGE